MKKDRVILVGSSNKSLDQRIDEKWKKIRKTNGVLKQRLEIATKGR
jgi:flavin-binding protein dodecin